MFQISHQLQEKKLLKSIRGPQGGFYLDKDPKYGKVHIGGGTVIQAMQ